MPNLENREPSLGNHIGETEENNTNAENVKSRNEIIEEMVKECEGILAENVADAEKISKNNIIIGKILLNLVNLAMEDPKNKSTMRRIKNNLK